MSTTAASTHAADARPNNIVTRRFAKFIAELQLSEVPEEVIEHAKWDALDTIGCAIYSQTLPIAQIMRDALSPISGNGEALIWGSDWKTTPDVAVLVNATLVHAYELDDIHTYAIMHPGGVSLSPAIALGSLLGRSGDDVLAAHIVGIEVCARVGVAVGRQMIGRGWHNLGTLGSLAAAASSARVLQLPEDQVLHALGIGGSLAGGLMASQYGSHVKRLHAGHAAQGGLRSALLAQSGFTGIEAIFEEPYGGYISSFGGVEALESLEELGNDFGEVWETLRVGFKPYSACGSSFTAIDTMIDLRKEHGFSPEEVERIDVFSSSATKDHVGWDYVPNTVTTAQLNLGYAAAVALIEGAAGVEQFSVDRISRPDIVALAQKVRVTVDPAIDERGKNNRFEIRAVVSTRNGETYEGRCVHARGSAARPMSFEERRVKFFQLATAVLSNSDAEAVFDGVMHLNGAPSVDDILSHLAVSAV